MKYIDELLKGHEVEWKELGEVAEIYGGLTGKSKSMIIMKLIIKTFQK